MRPAQIIGDKRRHQRDLLKHVEGHRKVILVPDGVDVYEYSDADGRRNTNWKEA